AIWVASVELLPLGHDPFVPDFSVITGLMGGVFLLAIGLVGASMLAIFLADIMIAFLSRTLPQMNVLLLGFQVKAMLMLITLPFCMSLSLGVFIRVLRLGMAEPVSLLGATQ
ncbi:MAG: flagellar biosynthetic protein FliR, partial [Pseudomonadota bacterium]